MIDTATSSTLQPSTNTGTNRTLLAVLEGHEVISQLADTSFMQNWNSLYELCPWSTPFQSSAFVGTWYGMVKQDIKPVMVLQKKDDKLTGLLTLALTNAGNIIYAGADIAEYQVWLAEPGLSRDFIKSAVEALRNTYPGRALCLRYIPANTPVAWVEQDPSLRYACELLRHKQPILDVNYTALAQELKKKNRKEKVNRLRRLGDLQFSKITDEKEFDGILDELVVQSDFRKGAMFDNCAFRQDPIRKDFLKSLFRLNLLHATVLRLDKTIIASNIGVQGKGWVHLQGINTHSPMHARYSPGILHFLMLGLKLAEEEVQVFDLTPGGDGYKHILATDYLEAFELNFYSPSKLLFNRFKREIQRFVLTHSSKVGLPSDKVKGLKKNWTIACQKLQLLRHYKPGSGVINQKGNLSTGKSSFQKIDPTSLPPAAHISLGKNSLSDLLLYSPKGTLQTRWEFLELAMRHFEDGCQGYTWTEKDVLLGCAWVSIPGKSRITNSINKHVPENACLISTLYIHPQMVTQKHLFLSALAQHLSQEADQNEVYLIT